MAQLVDSCRGPEPDEGYVGGPGESRDSNLDESHNVDDRFVATYGNKSPQRNSSTFTMGTAMAMSSEDMNHLIGQLSVESQRELVSRLLAVLPVSHVSDLVEETYTRLHIDPANILPLEVIENVFSRLDAPDLLNCSQASRAWRLATLTNTRWKLLFFRQGWLSDERVLQDLSTAEASRRKALDRLLFRKQSSSDIQGSTRKRQRSTDHTSLAANVTDTDSWNEQHGRVEADDSSPMQGVESANQESLSDRSDQVLEPFRIEQSVLHPLQPPLEPSLFKPHEQTPRFDWLYLFKQRRRLERNWDEGRFKSIRLPSVRYPREGHTECVYSIQYTGDFLVSGSRDKTVKIWDLSTAGDNRCIRTLGGIHRGSVLCLQFDLADDIIISGGSDALLVVWRFSTGEVVRSLDECHAESILNLRFDDRYLVTCSKDKSIKIWNRHPITKDSPIIPAASVQDFASYGDESIPEYTLLGTLVGHSAAVNAIQLSGGTIVSASGDRTIRLWDINTLTCVRQFTNHSKGIACVQFDGRRIVSGSSDRTVRIFDVATSAEVACLKGHQDLVRTVQARFCDQMLSDDDLVRAARRADREQELTAERERVGSPVHTTGALIPPGGGGNRWSRIVSGSYDESVVIWKKDRNNKWVIGRRLYQEEILQAAQNQEARNVERARQRNVVTAGAAGAAGAIGAAQLGPGQQVQLPIQQLPAGQAHGQPVFAPVPPNAGGHRRLPGTMPGSQADDSKRLLKLQFDSRRIICCSQNRMIVGWDFANGDGKLEEASRCFAASE